MQAGATVAAPVGVDERLAPLSVYLRGSGTRVLGAVHMCFLLLHALSPPLQCRLS